MRPGLYDHIQGWLVRYQVWLPFVLLSLGLAMRIAWLQLNGVSVFATGEASNVARHFAITGILGDTFRPGMGPSAHLTPVSPVIAGLVYRHFGVVTPLAEGVLATWALFLTLGGFYALYHAFRVIGAPLTACLAALALLCLQPINLNIEVVAFRIWETGLATALAAVYLLGLVRLDRRQVVETRSIVLMAILAGLLFFISPQLGLGAYAATAYLMWRRIPMPGWPGAIGMAVAGLALFIVPWTIRNAQVMGEPIALRSNFGLELSIGFHPEALQRANRMDVFERRLDTVHPMEGAAAYARLEALGGEANYARALGAETQAWMRANPLATLDLAARHLFDYLFPPDWLWKLYDNDGGRGLGLKVGLNWLISALGLLGMIAAWFGGNERYRYAIIMTVVTILPYVLVQPVLRYRYAVFPLLSFFACDLVVRVLMRTRVPGFLQAARG